MTSDRPTFAGMLRLPGVRSFMIGRFLAASGIWMERIAVGWIVWDMTGSAAWVGMAAFLRLVPTLVCGPIGGVLADRAGSVGLLMLTHGGNALVLILLAPFASQAPLAALCVAVTAIGVLQGLAAAPIKAVLAQIVPRAFLPSAVPASTAGFQLAGFVGPAMAGLAIVAGGAWLALFAAGLFHLVFVLILWRWTGRDGPGEAAGGTMLADFVQAARHSARDPLLAPVFLLHLAAALCLRPVIDLMPAIAGRINGAGAATLGFLTSALGAGAVLGAVLMALRVSGTELPFRILAGSTAAALIMAALPASSLLPVAAVLSCGFGFALVVRATASLTLIQLASPDGMRGRISGLYSMIMRAGTAFGALVTGVFADAAGLGVAFLAAGLAALILTAWQARRVHSLRAMLADGPFDRVPDGGKSGR